MVKNTVKEKIAEIRIELNKVRKQISDLENSDGDTFQFPTFDSHKTQSESNYSESNMSETNEETKNTAPNNATNAEENSGTSNKPEDNASYIPEQKTPDKKEQISPKKLVDTIDALRYKIQKLETESQEKESQHTQLLKETTDYYKQLLAETKKESATSGVYDISTGATSKRKLEFGKIDELEEISSLENEQETKELMRLVRESRKSNQEKDLLIQSLKNEENLT